MALTLKQLKAASYNPRSITAKRLKALEASYSTYGDLSGVVWNKRTRTLVSGHQRLKTIGDRKSTIVTTPHTDQYGTVAVGHIEVFDGKGIFQIPFRAVDWSDKKTEMAANIAANAHGGEFDKEKLRKVLAQLDPDKFDIELTGLDPLTIQSLSTGVGKSDSHGERRTADDSTFKEFDENSFEFDCKCPKCGYKWNSAKGPVVEKLKPKHRR